MRGVKKSFLDKQQQQVSMGSQSSQHSFSVSSTLGTNSTYRSFSSAQLRPSGTTGGYPPPFSLSGSNSVANLSSALNTGAGNNVGGGRERRDLARQQVGPTGEGQEQLSVHVRGDQSKVRAFGSIMKWFLVM